MTNGTTYQFRVLARNRIGWGPGSNVVSARPVGVPGAPRSLGAAVAPTVGVGSGQVRLNWSAPSSNGGAAVTVYAVQRRLGSNGTWTNIGFTSNRVFLAGGMTNGTTYQFRVLARNRIGWGRGSNVVSARP